MSIQDIFTKKGFLLNWRFNHLSRHWFLSILTFYFNAILVLFCKPSNPQHLLTCTHIQFCLSVLKLKCYYHSTAATLLLSIPSKVTGILQLFLRLTKLPSYCACKQEENGGNESEDLQLKFEEAGEDFPHSPNVISRAISPVASRQDKSTTRNLCLTTDDQKMVHNINFKCMIFFSSSINLRIKP